MYSSELEICKHLNTKTHINITALHWKNYFIISRFGIEQANKLVLIF